MPDLLENLISYITTPKSYITIVITVITLVTYFLSEGQTSKKKNTFSVRGHVFHDTNDNGVIDGTEEPISNLEIGLQTFHGKTMRNSDKYGRFSFDNLPMLPNNITISVCGVSQTHTDQDTKSNNYKKEIIIGVKDKTLEECRK